MLQTLLVYVYLRKLELNDENVYSILIAADYLSILGALDLCCKYLESILRPSNCVGILAFARAHFCRDLANSCWKYIMKNFTQVAAQSNEILTLSLKELQEIINADDLNVKSEETVWETILRYILKKVIGNFICLTNLGDRVRNRLSKDYSFCNQLFLLKMRLYLL